MKCESRWLSAFAALFVFACCGPMFAGDFVLVDRDLAPAPIVVGKDASPRTRASAATLADYIEKISGSRPEVIEGEPQPRPERAIWVGIQPALKALFPNTDFEFQHPEEIFLAANEKHLVIAGRDRWDPQRPDAEGGDEIIKGKQQEYGTINAVIHLPARQARRALVVAGRFG